MLNLSIDVTYPQYSDETGDKRTVFLHECHPLESGRCKLLALQANHPENNPVLLNFVMDVTAFIDDPENAHLDEIYRAVLLKTPESIISSEELNRLINDWLTPVEINRDES